MLGRRLMVDLNLDDRPRSHWNGLLEKEEPMGGPDEKLYRLQNVYLIPLGRRRSVSHAQRGSETDCLAAVLCRSLTTNAEGARRISFRRLGLVIIPIQYGMALESLQFMPSEDGWTTLVLFESKISTNKRLSRLCLILTRYSEVTLL